MRYSQILTALGLSLGLTTFAGADECRDVLELAARSYLSVNQSRDVHDRVIHDFCDAAEHFHQGKSGSDLSIAGQSFLAGFSTNSSDYERMYHSVCTHDDAIHEQSDYLLLTANLVEGRTVVAWSKCMSAHQGFETAVSDVTNDSFTLRVRWMTTCNLSTQVVKTFTPTNATCTPSLIGVAVSDQWQSVICKRDDPSLASRVVLRDATTWSGYAFVPALPKPHATVANCTLYEGDYCLACMFDPAFSGAAANQQWRFTCSHMPPNRAVRLSFSGTPTVTPGTPDNKIWNGGIWITLTTDDYDNCANADPRCFGQHRYSSSWTQFNIQNDVRIPANGRKTAVLTLAWCQTGPAAVTCTLPQQASLTIETLP